MVDYRGFGDSEGYMTEPGMLRDAEAIFSYVLSMPEINPYKIIVFGAALGGVPATHVAYNHQEKVRALILQNASPGVIYEWNKLFYFIKPIIPYIASLDLDIEKYISNLAIPVLFIKGLKDDMICKNGTNVLFEASRNSVYRKLHEVEDADHYSPWYHGGELYEHIMTDFIEYCMMTPVQQSSEARLKKLHEEKDNQKLTTEVNEDL